MELSHSVRFTKKAFRCYFIKFLPFFIFLFLLALLEPILALREVPNSSGIANDHKLLDFIKIFLCGLPLPMLIFGLITLLPKTLRNICLVLSILLINIYMGTNLFFVITQQHSINQESINILIDTNISECVDFVYVNKLFSCVVVMYLIALISIPAVYFNRKKLNLKFKKRLVGFFVCCIPMAILTLFNVNDLFHGHVGFVIGQPPLFGHFIEMTRQNNVRDINRMAAENKKELRFDFPEQVTGIILLGESASRQYMSCYGYHKDTTPFMKNQDWIKYSDVTASAPFTYLAATMIFTDKKQNGGNPTLCLLPLLAQNSNCMSSYLSNQHSSKHEALYPIFAGADSHRTIKNLIGHSDHDEVLLRFFEINENDLKTKNLYVMHFLGSHFPFQMRYPAEFDKFGDSKLGTYENTLIYTDWVINEIIQKVNKQNKPIWVLYLSDHGESPEGYVRGPTNYPVWEIPFAFYGNDAYKKQFPEMYERMKKCTDIPFSSDCTFELAMYLLGISYDGFDYSRVPIREGYKPVKRSLGPLPDRHPADAK